MEIRLEMRDFYAALHAPNMKLLSLACDFAEHGMKDCDDISPITTKALATVRKWIRGKATDDELEKATAEAWKTAARCRALWVADVLKAVRESEYSVDLGNSITYPYMRRLKGVPQLLGRAAVEAATCAMLNARSNSFGLYPHLATWAKNTYDDTVRDDEFKWQIDRMLKVLT